MADNMSEAGSRQGLRRANSTVKRFQDVTARLQQQIRREKEQASNDYLVYEKIRWPCYKDMVYRRKNMHHLPTNANQVKRMLGLTKAGPNPPTTNRGNSSARSRTIEKGGL